MPTRAMCKVGVEDEIFYGDKRLFEGKKVMFGDVSSYEVPLDAMEDLEEALPISRGLSRFYNGKSRSFANLADALSIKDIKELAKPDYACIHKMRKRRRNMLGGGTPTTSATNLALDVAMSNSTGSSPSE
ncbi:hypothetical protein AAHA92_32615 [Salvia divinorum]|uniref:Uncharacterized protein n=1 Tax=Salvia divinorum TaxID=28513 RepID=A0ABD1FPF1_SALDI